MRTFYRRWVVACTIAEALGIGTAALVAVGFDALIGGADTSAGAAVLIAAMACAGVIEGGALGLLQWRLLRTRLPRLRSGEWITPTVTVAVVFWIAGMAGPALMAGGDAGAAGPGLATTLALAAVVGGGAGALFGAAQWLVLRHHAHRSGRWIVVHIPAWAAAMIAIFLAASLPAATWSAAAIVVAGLCGGAVGGALLGLISGRAARELSPFVDEQRWSAAGKVYVVTGATRGIGLETARGFARMGGTVVLVCRDLEAGDRAAAELIDSTRNPDVHTVACDLGSLASVRIAAAEFARRWPRIDVLVNNAGATFAQRQLTVDGIEETLAVDAVGPFLLTTSLADRLVGRVVNLTGISHRRGHVDLDDLSFADRRYDRLEANNQAQAARLLTTVGLARRLPGVVVIAVHPGAVRTGAQADLPRVVRVLIATVLRPGFVRAELGASPVLRLALDPAIDDRSSGQFFDRFDATTDAAPPELVSRWWQMCEQLTGVGRTGAAPRGGPVLGPVGSRPTLVAGHLLDEKVPQRGDTRDVAQRAVADEPELLER